MKSLSFSDEKSLKMLRVNNCSSSLIETNVLAQEIKENEALREVIVDSQNRFNRV